MRSIDDLFQDYDSYHRAAGNKVCHRVGIPLIVFAIVGMLAKFEIGPLDLAVLVIGLTGIWYLLVGRALGALMVIVLVGFYLLAGPLPLLLHVGLFVTGWILQFIGHLRYEHRSPAFTKNLVHLLVGPLWILADALPSAARARLDRSS